MGWDMTHSDNHWSNLDLMMRYMQEIIEPHVQKTIKEKKLPAGQHAIANFDCWPVHTSAVFMEHLATKVQGARVQEAGAGASLTPAARLTPLHAARLSTPSTRTST